LQSSDKDTAARRLRVGVLMGGRSGEHEVSLMSARNVINALDPERFEPVLIGITRDGRWRLCGRSAASLPAGEVGDEGRPVALLTDPGRNELIGLEAGDPVPPEAIGRLDVVFPVLHGPFGEDGTVQGLLELAGVPYVGAGVLASAVGMDKGTMKDVFVAHGLSVPAYRVVLRRAVERDAPAVAAQLAEELGYPCFVKPCNLGSSVGISKAPNPERLVAALRLAARYDRRIIVERHVDGRELECSVLGNDDPMASVPGEIIPSREFYDYEAKYIDEKSRLLIPAPVPEGVAAEARRLAVKAFQAIDCAGMARVDLFLERKSNRLLLNEINTIPGFTAISMYPKLWEATGISQVELCTRLIELALERHADRARNETFRIAE